MSNYGSTDQAETIAADTPSSYFQWNADQVAEYLEKKGLPGYQELLQKNRINGIVASHLTDVDLKDMGITVVGDRIRFRLAIQGIARKARVADINKAVWEDTERLYFSDVQEAIFTCCGCCPQDPSKYKLTTRYLRIRTVDPLRCGPIICPCCNSYATNNIDLSRVDDVDVNGVPAPCFWRVFCCAAGKDVLEVTSSGEDGDGKVYMTIQGGDGEKASQLIMNQVEESQEMDRGDGN